MSPTPFLLIILLVYLSHLEHKRCTCWRKRGRGGFLRPNWKKINKRKDFDRYDDE